MTNSGGPTRLYGPQQDAVNGPTGPILVEGGPGTGKSFVLAARAARLLAGRVDPKSIFRLTPNAHMVEEIRRTLPRELRGIVDGVSKEASEAVEIHSIQDLAVLFLRHLGPASVQVSNDFKPLSRRQSEEIVRQLLSPSNLQARVADGDIPDILRWHRFRRSTIPETEVPGIPSLWHEIVDLYEREKRRQNALDQEDIILLATRAIEGSPDFIRRWRETRKPHYLVDDFQNLTQSQYRFLQTLAGTNGSLVAAGESNLCIGTWWGADAGLLDRFRQDNPACKHVKLDFNLRLSADLHAFAARLRETPPTDQPRRRNAEGNATSGGTRSTKPALLRFHGSKPAMYYHVAQQIKSAMARGQAPEDFAILVRRHSPVDQLKSFLSVNGIPCRELGQDRQVGAPPPGEGLAVGTFHAAQGRQWRHVWIADVDEDTIPGPIPPTQRDWIEEERRLLYVAATRAAESLHLICSTRNGMPSESRFLIPARGLLTIEDAESGPSNRRYATGARQ